MLVRIQVSSQSTKENIIGCNERTRLQRWNSVYTRPESNRQTHGQNHEHVFNNVQVLSVGVYVQTKPKANAQGES